MEYDAEKKKITLHYKQRSLLHKEEQEQKKGKGIYKSGKFSGSGFYGHRGWVKLYLFHIFSEERVVFGSTLCSHANEWWESRCAALS